MKIVKLIKSNFEIIHARYIGKYVIAQLGLLVISPFLSRIYNPSDLAIASIFYTVTSILGSTSTLSLENSILIEQEDKKIINGFYLSLASCFVFSLLLILFPYKSTLLNLIIDFNFENKFIIYLFPLSVILLGIYNSLRLLVIRSSQYNILGVSRIIIGILIPLLSIIFGINSFSYKGIIYSYLIGLFTVNLYILIGLFFKNKIQFKKLNFQIIGRLFSNHSKLIKWTMPSNLVSNFTASLPILFIGHFYGSELLGKYELAYRAIYFPLGIMISSFKDIFKEKITQEILKYGNCINTFNSFINILIRIAIFFLLPILIVFPFCFQFVFGEQWAEGGYLIQIMFLLICINFISSPLSITLIVCNRQKSDFIWQAAFCLTTSLSFLIPNYIFNLDIKSCLFIYSTISFCLYLIAIYLSKIASYSIMLKFDNK